MTVSAYKKFRRINALFLLFGMVYVLFFVAFNVAVVAWNISPLLLYSVPSLIAAGYLLVQLAPRPSRRGETCALESSSLCDSLARIGAELGLKRLPKLEIQFSANAFVYEHRQDCYVSFGLPLLVEYSQHELNAILAHEMAHELFGDTTRGRIAKQLELRVMRVGSLLSSRLTAAILLPFRPLFLSILRSVKKAQRAAEFEADSVAARFAGTDSSISALRKIAAIEYRWLFFLDRWAHFVLESGARPEIIGLYETFCKTQPIEDIQVASSSLSNEFDSHPTVAERIKQLELSVHQGSSGGPAHAVLNKNAVNRFFYSAEDAADQAPATVESTYQEIGSFLKKKYAATLADFRWKDLPEFAWRYASFSGPFFEITKVDDGFSERRLFVFLISFLIFEHAKQSLRLTAAFTPVLNLGPEDWDVGASVAGLLGGPEASFAPRLEALGIPLEEFVVPYPR